jgi:hypothetical protein
MNTILKVAAAAIIALTSGVAIDPLRPDALFGAADPSPSASPGPAPMRNGRLPAGTYVAMPFTAPGSDVCYTPPQAGCSEAVRDDDIAVTLTVPDGWDGDTFGSVFLADTDSASPTWAAILLERGAWLLGDPCHGAEGADIPVGPTAADFADALVAHPLLDVTTPVDITLAGYPGKYLELQVPSDSTIQGSSEPASLEGCPLYRPWEPGIFAQRPGERWLLTALDVGGTRVVIREMVHEGTTAEVKTQLQGIVDSIAIEPATGVSPSPAPST